MFKGIGKNVVILKNTNSEIFEEMTNLYNSNDIDKATGKDSAYRD